MNSKVDINNLSIDDVHALIQAEKMPTNILKYQDIMNQIHQTLILSSYTYKCRVKDVERQILYDFRVHTTPVSTIFSIGLMFDENKNHLVWFDFGENLRHVNDYGTENEKVIYGSHVHFNSPAGKYVPKNVIPVGGIDEFKT